MGKFTGYLEYEETNLRDNGRDLYRILSPMSYLCDQGSAKGIEIEIEPGFLTDFASIPSLFFLLKPADKDWARESVFHDKACILAHKPKATITLTQADDLFYYAMVDHGKVWKITAWLFWLWVRTFRAFKT